MRDGALVSDGGRVLSVTARGASLGEARDRAYGVVAAVDWPEAQVRHDIGWRALGRAAVTAS
jgi:phosphoribosylamine---glycine ligase